MAQKWRWDPKVPKDLLWPEWFFLGKGSVDDKLTFPLRQARESLKTSFWFGIQPGDAAGLAEGLRSG